MSYAENEELVEYLEPYSDPKNNSRPFYRYRWSTAEEALALVEMIGNEIRNLRERQRARGKSVVVPHKNALCIALRVVLSELCHNYFTTPRRYIGISRDNNAKFKASRYNNTGISYTYFIHVIDGLKDLGYITQTPFHYDALNSENNYSSRIIHTIKLAELIRDYGIKREHICEHPDKETIIKRGKPKKVRRTVIVDGVKKKRTFKVKPDIDYADGETPNRARTALAKYNKLLSETYIDINFDFSRVFLQKPIYLDSKSNYRIFSNNSWSENGRYHGAFWQSMPSNLRKYIAINGEETVELDYTGIHFALLYARAGSVLQDDPYSVPNYLLQGSERRLVKKLLIAMLYGKDEEGAIYSYFRAWKKDEKAEEYPEKEYSYEELKAIIEIFKERHETIENEFGKDQATKLMRYDSTLATQVIKEMTSQREPILCIHDSFIVRKSAEPMLRDCMNKAYLKLTTSHRDYKDSSIIDESTIAGLKRVALTEADKEYCNSAEYERRLAAWRETSNPRLYEVCGIYYEEDKERVKTEQGYELISPKKLGDKQAATIEQSGLLDRLLSDRGYSFDSGDDLTQKEHINQNKQRIA